MRKRIKVEFIEKRITSWDEFDELINQFNYRGWVYRGQASAKWKLESSLVRLLKAAALEKNFRVNYKKLGDIYKHYEKIMIERFKAGAHLYLNNLPDDNDFEWLSIMQHYGVPTRLIDVTFSPYIACFFALYETNEDAAIYALEHSFFVGVLDSKFEKISDISEEHGLITYEPKKLNERLHAQQGLFLVTNNLEKPIENFLEKTNCLEDSFYKIIIPKELRDEGIIKLRKMNITYKTLFSGLEGFSKSIKDILFENHELINRFEPIEKLA